LPTDLVATRSALTTLVQPITLLRQVKQPIESQTRPSKVNSPFSQQNMIRRPSAAETT
jgi:hypothetical protein